MTHKEILTIIQSRKSDAEKAEEIMALVPKDEWPKEGCEYFYLDSYCDVYGDTFSVSKCSCVYRKKTGNVFHTYQEAESVRDRILSGELVVRVEEAKK